MTYTRNYVIAGGRHGTPASLSVKMEPVKLDDKMGIALKSIACGELANITNSCNSFKIKFNGDVNEKLIPIQESSDNMVYSIVNSFMEQGEQISYDVANNSENYREITLRIPTRRYERKEDIFGEVVSAINNFLTANAFERRCELSSSYGKLSCYLPEGVKLVKEDTNTPLSLIDAVIWETEMTAEIGEIKSSVDICFIYLNIVQFSFINGRRSRLLCVCPIECKRGYTYIEFANPTYTPIEVQEFSDMSLSIRDIHGKLLDLDNRFDTVATLHMKKM